MTDQLNTNKFKPTFENGGFWEYYKDLENQFQNFLEYVPYLNGNENTYSFKLLSQILSIGGYIDSAFNEMARFSKFSENEICLRILRRAAQRLGIIKSGIEAFDNLYNISNRTVTFKFIPERVDIQPFNCTDTIPEWWDFYNELKHDVGINLEKANLKNTRDALAAAFLLNVIHEPGILRLYNYDVLKFYTIVRGEPSKHLSKSIPRKDFERLIHERQSFWGSVQTDLFVYDFNQ
ncbi:hypothetical protein ACFLRN_05240 [Thermoproteota archaeon]